MEEIKRKNKLSEDLIFQQDNAVCHTSRESKAAIEVSFGENVIEWPPNSPDLSPIEKVWVIIKEKLSKRRIKNFDELRDKILDIGSNFLFQYVKNYVLNSKINYNTLKSIMVKE